MIAWEKFISEDQNLEYAGQILTDIQCPECGKNIYFDSSIILTSYPCKYSYWCRCGWTGYASQKWTKDRKDETDAV